MATDTNADLPSAGTSSVITVPIDTETAVSDDTKNDKTTVDGTYERAIVRNVSLQTETQHGGAEQKQIYTVEYLSGPLNGQTKELSTDLESNPFDLRPNIGDHVIVLLQANPEGGEPLAFLEGFDRRAPLFWLMILFVMTLVLLAGWQGIKVAFSIFLSILLIGWVLIPAFINGINPIPIAFLLAAVFVTLSSTLSTGWNKKSLVTIIGTLGGTFVAYLLSVVFSHWAHLGGLSSEEDRLFFSKNPLLDPRGLLFAGIIIASLGVVEDVAVSISSGVAEVHRANPRLGFKELFRSGMIVGRDHMSALANTLIFAYVGASLSTLLLYTQYGGSWLKFLNFDSVVDEIIRSLAATIGLIFTVPITALLAAAVCRSSQEMKTLSSRYQEPSRE
jgi:uncharacterized membrane protein